MANVKISGLPSVLSLGSSDVIPSVAGSSTSKITVQNLANSLTQVSSSISASFATNAATSSRATTASFAVTASYALNAGGGATPGGSDNQIQYRVNASTFGGVSAATWDGSTLRVTGSFTGSLTGSFLGTASYAAFANSASYSVSSSRAVTASFAISASYSVSSSYAVTSSYAVNSTTSSYAVSSSYAVTASYAASALSSSYALTASYVNDLNQNLTITGSVIISGSPSPEIRVIGEMVVTGSMIVSGANGSGVFSQGATLIDYVSGISTSGSYTVWRAPFSCSVVALYGYREGGTAPQVNAIKSGSGGYVLHSSANVTVTNANVWTAASTLQNQNYAPGDSLQVVISGSGNNQVAVQVDFIKKF